MLCERASGSKTGLGIGDYGIIMVKYDSLVVMSLNEFCNKQNEQCNYALSQLRQLKDEVMGVAYDSCLVIILNFYLEQYTAVERTVFLRNITKFYAN
jgi:hypothetical protein